MSSFTCVKVIERHARCHYIHISSIKVTSANQPSSIRQSTTRRNASYTTVPNPADQGHTSSFAVFDIVYINSHSSIQSRPSDLPEKLFCVNSSCTFSLHFSLLTCFSILMRRRPGDNDGVVGLFLEDVNGAAAWRASYTIVNSSCTLPRYDAQGGFELEMQLVGRLSASCFSVFLSVRHCGRAWL